MRSIAVIGKNFGDEGKGGGRGLGFGPRETEGILMFAR